MGKKKDSTSKRIKRAIKQPVFLAPGSGHEDRSPVWSQCSAESRALEANRATTLAGPWGDNIVLRKAFEDHRLDPHNPWNWRGLLFTYVSAKYGIKPEGGRPPDWTPGERERFTDDYNTAVTDLHKQGRKRLLNSPIAKRMRENSPGRYPQKPATLVKYFSRYLVKERMRK